MEAAFPEAFINMYYRKKADYESERIPPPHPSAEAVLQATDERIGKLQKEEGTWIGMLVGEQRSPSGGLSAPRVL
jgi:hypothetical protein